MVLEQPVIPIDFDPGDFAARIREAFLRTADSIEDRAALIEDPTERRAQEEASHRIQVAYELWAEAGPSAGSPYVRARPALDTTILAAAGLDGELVQRWQELAERFGPPVEVDLRRMKFKDLLNVA